MLRGALRSPPQAALTCHPHATYPPRAPPPQFIRVDFNVPQDKATGRITNTQRIDAAIPTIKYALDKGAKVRAAQGWAGRQ